MEVKNEYKWRNSAFHGLVMSVLAVTLFLLYDAFTREVTLFIIVAAILLTILGGLLLRLLKKTKHKSLRVVLIIAVFLLDFAAVFTVTIRQMSNKMLFYPYQDEESYACLSRTDDMEELSIPSENGNIGGWFYHKASDQAPLLLYFAGNGQCAAAWMWIRTQSLSWRRLCA